MPRTKVNKVKGTQRQFMTEEEGPEEVKKSSSERKLERRESADLLRPFQNEVFKNL